MENASRPDDSPQAEGRVTPAPPTRALDVKAPPGSPESPYAAPAPPPEERPPRLRVPRAPWWLSAWRVSVRIMVLLTGLTLLGHRGRSGFDSGSVWFLAAVAAGAGLVWAVTDVPTRLRARRAGLPIPGPRTAGGILLALLPGMVMLGLTGLLVAWNWQGR